MRGPQKPQASLNSSTRGGGTAVGSVGGMASPAGGDAAATGWAAAGAAAGRWAAPGRPNAGAIPPSARNSESAATTGRLNMGNESSPRKQDVEARRQAGHAARQSTGSAATDAIEDTVAAPLARVCDMQAAGAIPGAWRSAGPGSVGRY